jgi:hypothetical protein
VADAGAPTGSSSTDETTPDPAAPTAAGAATTEGPARQGSAARTGVVLAVAVVVSVLAFVVGTMLITSGETVTYVIPAGTGAAVDAGEPVEVIPARVELSVGDTLQLINEDTRPHVIGPWTVMPGTEFSFTFDEPADFSAQCTTHPDRTVRIIAA